MLNLGMQPRIRVRVRARVSLGMNTRIRVRGYISQREAPLMSIHFIAFMAMLQMIIFISSATQVVITSTKALTLTIHIEYCYVDNHACHIPPLHIPYT